MLSAPQVVSPSRRNVRGRFTEVLLRTVGMFNEQEAQRRSSIMEVLNIVFSALNLLATVVIGVIQVTWMISRDVFRDKPKAKHYSHDKKQTTASQFPNSSGRLLNT